MVLAPFSDWRTALGTTFIIDLWFSGIILAGLLASILVRKTRLPALAALAVLVGYIGFQFLQREDAIEFGERYAKERGMRDARVAVHPRPVSPFNWTVFVSDEREHRFAHVNLVRSEPRRYQPGDGFVARVDSPYLPLSQAIWVRRSRYGEGEVAREAWESPALGFYRWFADQPAFDGSTEAGKCHWFIDLRFVNPGREWVPFQFGACRDKPGEPWAAYERQGQSGRLLLLR